MQFHKIYRPYTARPFFQSDSYMELEPCEALKPYIRCFWGSRIPFHRPAVQEPEENRIIPDTCMDIIFNIDYTDNRIHNQFCGINDQSFLMMNLNSEERLISTFAIRFYVWSVILFAEDSMKNVKNGFFDVGEFFSELKRGIMPLLFDITGLAERAAAAENFLLRHLRLERENPIFTKTIGEILIRKGNVRVEQLARELHTSSRQIQRIFKENTGISPKKLSSLIRYQYIWNEAMSSRNFDVQDAVYRYGYADQAHLLNDFRRFHGVGISEAVMGARSVTGRNVAFLQSESPNIY